MTERDAELWWQADRTIVYAFSRRPARHQRDASPCDDCCREFAASMRPDRCNGRYPEEPIPEPEPMPNDWRRREGYATEEERYEARLATMRRAGRLYRNNLKRRATA